jgi:hypothetical protein
MADIVFHLFRYDESKNLVTYFYVPVDKGDNIFIALNFALKCFSNSGFISYVFTYESEQEILKMIDEEDDPFLEYCDYSDYCKFKYNNQECKNFLKTKKVSRCSC